MTASAPAWVVNANIDGFSGRLRLAADAASTLALALATWEPHDWSTFRERRSV